MKLAFSSLGCPELSWQAMTSMAKDLGFHGIELRTFGDTPGQELTAALDKLKTGRLEVSCLSTGSSLQYPGSARESAKAEIRRAIALAQALGTAYVRVLGDRTAEPCDPVEDDDIRAAMRELLPAAEAAGVTLLIETNGVYAETKRLAALLASLGSDAVGALWDLHHPYRFGRETPAQTVANLGAFIKYVHCKDSVMEDGRVCYKLMGDGDLPIELFLRALRSINYEGFLSMEWLKRYAPELEEAGIVFPHYVNYMETLLRPGECKTNRLYDNARKTGKYIWPKETLVNLTFPQVLDCIAEEFPEQYAFRYTTLNYTRTYREFRDEVDAFARALIAMGVRPGDHIAIWATNVPQWFVTFWASVKIGAVLVTVNTAYKIHEAEYLLRQSDTHTLVMIEGHKDSDYAGIVRQLCPELEAHSPGQPLHCAKLPFLRNIITVDFRLPGCLDWQSAMALEAQAPQEEVLRRAAALRKDDVCNMQYTSGTTGFPKGVMLTHYNIVNNGKTIGDGMDLSTADKLMIQVPMFHCFGMVLAMTASVTHGTTMCPIPAFSPALGLDCIHKEQITAFHGVPTMFIAMLAHENFSTTDFSHMRTGIMAGSPCPIKVMEEVLEKMHMPEITIVFGQTESSPGCTMSRTTDSIETRVNTVGRAFYGVECKIVDPETNEDLPDHVDGEFVARGYNIMRGYYKMPEATAAAIDADGWLHTGDLARRDADGNYKITGRIKDMIIRGGENIYPKEIEDFIYTHPKVSDVQVVGVPSRAYGEEIMAWVILKPGNASSEEEIREFVLAHMAKHKVPRYVHFTDTFPMNAAGKILKYKMRETAIELLGLQNENKIVTA
ncbi:MAG: AMP-binding protein [Oscillospiraceae bacterium]|jgi:fatty-acyl-CoA synthase|nr:AMP-binding protein [Oscillospiraceae bacterium]